MFTINCRGRLLVLDSPMIMGIINVTPDSFYEGSRFQATDHIVQQAEEMLKAGANILDIGAQSTRPGSKQAGADEELRRLTGTVESLHRHFPSAIISIDTYHAKVAVEAVSAGATIVNDISGGSMDPSMIETVGRLQVPYICMHIKGTPENMHQNPTYENVTLEVLDYFIQKTAECRNAGIHDIIIDPGFGFGKTIAHNFTLLHNLPVLSVLQKPILVGLSRKSTVYKTLGVTAAEALNGTTVMHTIGLLKNANILRVHDVREAVEAVKMVTAYNLANKNL